MEKLSGKNILLLLVTGVLAGVTGIVLTLLMHTVQHYTFGYGFLGEVSFRQVVEHASPMRRLMALIACGLTGGVGWVLIHRYGGKLVSIKDTVNGPRTPMPVLTTLLHAVLQIITVGMGSPLGREVAPREFSTALVTQLMKYISPDAEARRVILACAAGAGLAAVYNAPISASIFILETMLLSWSLPLLGAALISCGTAVLVVRLGLGDLVQYVIVPPPALSESLMIWAVFAGPVIALAVFWFDQMTSRLPKFDRKSPRMILLAVGAFALVGIASMWYPEILGNGKPGNQLTFADLTGWQYAIGLFVTKWGAVLLAMLAGAYGGRITPSMMLGSTMALVLAHFWSVLVVPVPEGAAAFVGAAVFLGLGQKMPLTAGVFLLELSRFSPAYLFPICLCMGTAAVVLMWLRERAA